MTELREDWQSSWHVLLVRCATACCAVPKMLLRKESWLQLLLGHEPHQSKLDQCMTIRHQVMHRVCCNIQLGYSCSDAHCVTRCDTDQYTILLVQADKADQELLLAALLDCFLSAAQTAVVLCCLICTVQPQQ